MRRVSSRIAQICAMDRWWSTWRTMRRRLLAVDLSRDPRCERDPRLCMSMPVALNHRGNDVATHVAHAGHEDLLPKAKFPLPRSTT